MPTRYRYALHYRNAYDATPVNVRPLLPMHPATEGLQLYTDDERLRRRLQASKWRYIREYLVAVAAPDPSIGMSRLQGRPVVQGIGRATRPRQVACSPVAAPPRSRELWVRIVACDGDDTTIWQLCEAVQWQVTRLIRTRVGQLHLGMLRGKAARLLTDRSARSILL